jgi:hypothetical protein
MEISTSIVGHSLKNIVAELHKTLPWLKNTYPDLNERTVAHLFVPANKGRTAAHQYKGIYQARPAGGDNTYHEPHPLVCLLHPCLS